MAQGCVNIEFNVALLQFPSLVPYWTAKIAINDCGKIM